MAIDEGSLSAAEVRQTGIGQKVCSPMTNYLPHSFFLFIFLALVYYLYIRAFTSLLPRLASSNPCMAGFSFNQKVQKDRSFAPS
jgi:hypothetical protein